MNVDNIQAFIDDVQQASSEYKAKIEQLTTEFNTSIQPMIENIDLLIRNFGDDVQEATDTYKQSIADSYDENK